MRKPLALLLTLSIAIAAVVPAVALAETRTVGKKSSGHTLHLKKGDVFKVRLTENPSTGYGWKVTAKPDKAVLAGKGSKFVSGPDKDENGNTITGAPGKRTFSWKAAGTGTTSLTIRYLPPGTGGKPAGTVRYTVKVR